MKLFVGHHETTLQKTRFSVDYEYFCDIMKSEDSGVDQLSWC